MYNMKLFQLAKEVKCLFSIFDTYSNPLSGFSQCFFAQCLLDLPEYFQSTAAEKTSQWLPSLSLQSILWTFCVQLHLGLSGHENCIT